MRLFAPRPVTEAASKFLETTRLAERFGTTDVYHAVEWKRENPEEEPPPSLFSDLEPTALSVGSELLAAMRSDLGAEPAPNITLGEPTEPIPLC